MSIFSQMKRAHKHKEQSPKPMEQNDEKPIPYKHIPTHAASDAITGSPASWGAKERTKIREENRKRSAMAAAQAHAYHMNMPSAPQGGSGSSSVAFTSGEVTPMVPSPGAITWSIPNYNAYSDEETYPRPLSNKGKEVDRRGACYFDIPHGSPISSKGGTATTTTPQERRRSLSSQDVLDTRPTRSMPVMERPTTTSGPPHRLHPSSRRTSDASIDRLVNTSKNSSSNVIRDSRPPPSMRGFRALPPLPQIAPIHLNTGVGSSSSPTTPSLKGQSSNQSTPQLGSSRRNSFASLPNLTPTSTRFTLSTPPTPTRTVVVKKAEFTMLAPSPRSPSMNFDFQLGQDSLAKIKAAYDIGATPRSARFEDDPFIDSSVGQLDFGLPGTETAPTRSRPPVSYINVFPEPSSPPHGTPKSRRKFSLSKTGSKLLKKKRWSISKPIPIGDRPPSS